MEGQDDKGYHAPRCVHGRWRLAAYGNRLLTPARTVAEGTELFTELLQGRAAFTDWSADRPGLRRHIRPTDLPPADLGASFSNGVRITHRSATQKPVVPSGFEISRFAEGLDGPRLIRAAPNGDIFVAESGPGGTIWRITSTARN